MQQSFQRTLIKNAKHLLIFSLFEKKHKIPSKKENDEIENGCENHRQFKKLETDVLGKENRRLFQAACLFIFERM